MKGNKSRTGANLEGRPKASCDGVEAAERFGAKIFEKGTGGRWGLRPPPLRGAPPPPLALEKKKIGYAISAQLKAQS